MRNTPSLNSTRIDVADVLRGLSVMGIIILHTIEHFNFYSFPETNPYEWMNFTDKAIWDSLFFLLGGKAYAVFALLFGFSFFIQSNNQEKRGKDFRGRFMWRLLLLFIIGNLNALFFPGEILVTYSILGFVLVAVCRLPNKAVFTIAIICLLQPMAWFKLIDSVCNPDALPAASMASYHFKQVYIAQSEGTFLETLQMNFWHGQLASLTWAWEHGRVFQTSALFMFGMLIGRKGLFLNSEKNLKKWLSILAYALIAYFPLTGLHAMLPSFMDNQASLQSANLILKSLANFSFMLVLVSGVILAFYTTKLQTLFLKITPYGKMSLTNYLMQSVIGSMLFFNWGFCLHNKLGITFSFLVGILFFILQFAFCNWWMKHHKHGPMEYIWKQATWLNVKH